MVRASGAYARHSCTTSALSTAMPTIGGPSMHTPAERGTARGASSSRAAAARSASSSADDADGAARAAAPDDDRRGARSHRAPDPLGRQEQARDIRTPSIQRFALDAVPRRHLYLDPCARLRQLLRGTAPVAAGRARPVDQGRHRHERAERREAQPQQRAGHEPEHHTADERHDGCEQGKGSAPPWLGRGGQDERFGEGGHRLSEPRALPLRGRGPARWATGDYVALGRNRPRRGVRAVRETSSTMIVMLSRPPFSRAAASIASIARPPDPSAR